MEIKYTSSFLRELKKLRKKHYPVKLLSNCLKAISEQDINTLRRIKDHALQGKWNGYREFHPSRYSNYGKNYDQWIVVYKINKDQLVLTLISTGTHEILN